MLSASLRKAAILIQALDEAAADALLEQMGNEQAAKVRSALMELDAIPPEEERAIVAEFLGRKLPLSTAPPATESGVELELSADSELLAANADAIAAPHQTSAEPPFAFLSRISTDVVARDIAREQPQTIAAVLAHLPPEQAAGVLESLPVRVAMEALERMASIDRLSPEVLADLENELRSRLSPHLMAEEASAHSLDRLSAVLAAMDVRQREHMVAQLSRRNTALAGRLGLRDAVLSREPAIPPVVLRYRIESTRDASDRNANASQASIEFAELADLDDDSLRSVFAAARPELVLLALTGADHRLIERVLKKLTMQEAAALRHRLDNPGPVRLKEIDSAQRKLAGIAERLIGSGQAQPPRRARFAAAA